VIERIEKGQLQRIDIAINSPVRNLSRKGPPIPDEGLSVNIVASGVTVRPVDQMPAVRDADLKAKVTGRTVLVTIGQGIADTPTGARSISPTSRSKCPTWRRNRRLRRSGSVSMARLPRRLKSWRPTG